jgi:hypothetical protein
VSGGWNGKNQTVGKDERVRDEQAEGEPTVLPAREAMALISPVPGTLPDATAAQDAATDAQASASGEESVTSEDRSEHFESSDSASSET